MPVLFLHQHEKSHKGRNIEDVKEEYQVFFLHLTEALSKDDESEHDAKARGYLLVTDLPDPFDSLESYDKEQRVEYECLSVEEPVRCIKYLPCFIKSIDRQYEINADKEDRVDLLLLRGSCLAHEEQNTERSNGKAQEEVRKIM